MFKVKIRDLDSSSSKFRRRCAEVRTKSQTFLSIRINKWTHHNISAMFSQLIIKANPKIARMIFITLQSLIKFTNLALPYRQNVKIKIKTDKLLNQVMV